MWRACKNRKNLEIRGSQQAGSHWSLLKQIVFIFGRKIFQDEAIKRNFYSISDRLVFCEIYFFKFLFNLWIVQDLISCPLDPKTVFWTIWFTYSHNTILFTLGIVNFLDPTMLSRFTCFFVLLVILCPSIEQKQQFKPWFVGSLLKLCNTKCRIHIYMTQIFTTNQYLYLKPSFEFLSFD
jgi:hypothetical protein